MSHTVRHVPLGWEVCPDVKDAHFMKVYECH